MNGNKKRYRSGKYRKKAPYMSIADLIQEFNNRMFNGEPGIQVKRKQPTRLEPIASLTRTSEKLSEPLDAKHRTIKKKLISGTPFSNLQDTTIWRGVSPGTHFGTNPQYSIQQMLDLNKRNNGGIMIAYDIESIGRIDPWNNIGDGNDRFFAPIEFAAQVYKFNSDPTEFISANGKKVPKYFSKVNDLSFGINIFHYDDNVGKYASNLVEQLKKVNTTSTPHTLRNEDLLALQRFIMLANGNYDAGTKRFAMNSGAAIPTISALTREHVGMIEKGISNLQAWGLDKTAMVAEMDTFVSRVSGGKSYKTMAFNGNRFDERALKYYLEGLKIFRSKKYQGNFDTLDIINTISHNPAGLFLGKKGAPQNLTQEALHTNFFGENKHKIAHIAMNDTEAQVDVANYVMWKFNEAYTETPLIPDITKPIKPQQNINMHLGRPLFPTASGQLATYDNNYIRRGDKVYSDRGFKEKPNENIFGIISTLENGKLKEVETPNSFYSGWVVSANTEYTVEGMTSKKYGKKKFQGLVLHNVDDDQYLHLFAEDNKILQNIIHENFTYMGSDVDMIRNRKNSVKDNLKATNIRNTDLSRRAYGSMFEFGTADYRFNTYMKLHEAVEASGVGKDIENNIRKDFSNIKDIKDMQKKIASEFKVTEAQARNYIYMRDRLESESPIFLNVKNKINTRFKGDKGTRDAVLYNIKTEMDQKLGKHTTGIKWKANEPLMFVFDSRNQKYALSGIKNTDSLARSISTNMLHGPTTAQHRRNAIDIIEDFYDRKYISRGQRLKLLKSAGELSNSISDPERPMYIARNIASEVLKTRDVPADKTVSGKKLITLMKEEFKGVNDDYHRRIKGSKGVSDISPEFKGKRVSTLQENMEARIGVKALSDIEINDMTERAIAKAKEGELKKFPGSKLYWDDSARDYFNKYDDYMRARAEKISSNQINFAKNYTGIQNKLDNLVGHYIQAAKNEEIAISSTMFFSKDKNSVIIALYDQSYTDRIKGLVAQAREGGEGLTFERIEETIGKDIVKKMEIALPEMRDGVLQDTTRVGAQVRVNPLYLDIDQKYLGKGGDLYYAYADANTERMISSLQRNAYGVIDMMKTGQSTEAINARLKGVARGSIDMSSTLQNINVSDYNDNMYVKGTIRDHVKANLVNVEGLFKVFSQYEDTEQLYGRRLAEAMRTLQSIFAKSGNDIGFNAVRVEQSLKMFMSSGSAANLMPMGAYTSLARDNMLQWSNPRKLDRAVLMDRARAGEYSFISNLEADNLAYPVAPTSVMMKIAYASDIDLMDKFKDMTDEEFFKEYGITKNYLTTHESMALVSDKFRTTDEVRTIEQLLDDKEIESRFFSSTERVKKTVYNESELTDEMKKLMREYEETGEVIIPALADREKGQEIFTIGRSKRNEIISYGDRHALKLASVNHLDDGQIEFVFDKFLPAENSTKLMAGTNKANTRFITQKLIDDITGGSDVDAIMWGEFAKKEEFGTPLIGTIQLAVKEAMEAGKTEEDVIAAMQRNFGINVSTVEQKLTAEENSWTAGAQKSGLTIGDATILEITRFKTEDLTSMDSTVPASITRENIQNFWKELNPESNTPNTQFLMGWQEVRRADVSEHARSYGANIPDGRGVSFGMRDMEIIRHKRININGKSYGTATNLEGWYLDHIEKSRGKRFGSKRSVSQTIEGLMNVISSANTVPSDDEAERFVTTRVDQKSDIIERPNYKQINFQRDIKQIDNFNDITSDKDLRGTFFDPALKGKDTGGFIFQTPFDFQIEGDPTIRDKIFIYQDYLNLSEDGSMGSEMQNLQLKIEKDTRTWLKAAEGLKGNDLSDRDFTRLNEIKEKSRKDAERHINKYVHIAGKEVRASDRTVGKAMTSARLGYSADLIFQGVNVEMSANSPDINTVGISEGTMRNMFAGSGLSEDQFKEIIDFSKTDEGMPTLIKRYPLFDEGGLVYGKMKIDPNAAKYDSTVVASLGLAMRVKGDYDGDHIYLHSPYADNLVKAMKSGKKLTEIMSQTKEYYNNIVAGKMSLEDVKDGLYKNLTEYRLGQESDRAVTEIIHKYSQANFVKAVKSNALPNINLLSMFDTVDEKTGEKLVYKIDRLTAGEITKSQNFINMNARLLKQVGSASNLNTKVRRSVEALMKVPGLGVTEETVKTIGDAVINTQGSGMVYKRFFMSMGIDEDLWGKLSTAYSSQEQTGISSKHLLEIMKSLNLDPNALSEEDQKRVFQSLDLFYTGIKTLNVDDLTKAHEEFGRLGISDIIKHAASAAELPEQDFTFAELRNMTPDAIDAWQKTWKGFGKEGSENATEAVISSIGTIGKFYSRGDFSSNPFLQFQLSEPYTTRQAIDQTLAIENYLSPDFIPTDAVIQFYESRGWHKELAEGTELYNQRMLNKGKELANQYIGRTKDVTGIVDDATMKAKTIGGDLIGSITRGVQGIDPFSGVKAGAIAFGGLWAISSMVRKGPQSDEEDDSQENALPQGDEPYINPAIFGPAPAGSAPSARVRQRGSGYENININISANDSHGWSEADIRAIVQQQLNEQMPVGVNMHTTSTDNTNRIDRQWVNDTFARAMQFGYAF